MSLVQSMIKYGYESVYLSGGRGLGYYVAMTYEGHGPGTRRVEPERQYIEVNDDLTDGQRRLFIEAVDSIGEIEKHERALLDSHPAVLVLAARNAAVTLNNIFATDFLHVQTQQAQDEEISFDLNSFTHTLEGLASFLEMFEGQMPVQPYLEPPKVEVAHPTELRILYMTLLSGLKHLRQQQLRRTAGSIDITMELVRYLFHYWEGALPLVNEPGKHA